MSNIKNAHIQGDLTISSNLNEIGVINTNFLEETTSSQGIAITNSNLKIKSNLQFTNNTAFSTNLSLGEDNIFTLENSSGNLNIFSKGGKGLSMNETTGNIILTSTADSISNTTGGLITNGGLLVGKTLNVKEDINGLDGLHTLTNTNSSQNVLDIKSTSNNGKSSISFKDSSDTLKLDIGYGNSTVTSPLTNTSYIQSVGGSNLLFRGNSTDSMIIDTTGSVEFYNTTSSSSTSAGAVKFRGGISISNSTDSTSTTNGGSITVAGGVSIQKRLYLASSLNLSSISTPDSPASGTIRFYSHNSDNLLKSLSNTGVLTTYQPTNTKGDLLTHNGTTQVRLPIGNNNNLLLADSTESSGIKWINPSLISTGLRQSFPITQKKITTSSYTLVTSFLYGGSTLVGSITKFSFSSYKNTSTSFTYSVRLWDTVNKLVLVEMTGLSNQLPINTSTTNISNIPTGEALLEFQCKISTQNNYGVILTSVNFNL